MTVKENHPTLRATIELLLNSEVTARVTVRRVVEREVGHGRIERRKLVCSDVMAGQTEFAGLAQIYRIERERTEKKTGKRTVEVVHGITDLTAKQAGPKRLLRLNRGHWGIENKSHHVRDVTFDEDRSQVRIGAVAQVMAAIRNTAIGLLRLAGRHNIAPATRYYRDRPFETLALIGACTDF
jgi:predicted transposase YbfD/YdcC